MSSAGEKEIIGWVGIDSEGAAMLTSYWFHIPVRLQAPIFDVGGQDT